MRVRKLGAGAAAAAMVMGGVAFTAPPANADAATVVVGCTLQNVTTNGGVQMTYPDGCRGRLGLQYGNFDYLVGGGSYDSRTFPYLSQTSMSLTGLIVVWTTTGTCDYTQYLPGAWYAGEVPSPTAVGAGCFEPEAPIPAWVQAYGRDGADAPCLEGWDASWQEWAAPVTGGWVCTRSIPSLG